VGMPVSERASQGAFVVRALDVETWPAFARLVEAKRTPEGLRLNRYLRFAFARKPLSLTTANRFHI